MKLIFGDPESIAARDKARKEAECEQRECESCDGSGEAEATFYCRDPWCKKGGVHDMSGPCPCCNGYGEIRKDGEEAD